MPRVVLVLVLAACSAPRAPAVPMAPAEGVTTTGTPPPGDATARLPAHDAASSSDADDAGDETVLTAKRWRYAPYFSRLKREIARQWQPTAVWRSLQSARTSSLGTATRVTKLRVELSPRGDVVSALVAESSGVPELDDEGVRAFRAAAPFGEVPQGLEKDGHVGFFFAFYFEPGSATANESTRTVVTPGP